MNDVLTDKTHNLMIGAIECYRQEYDLIFPRKENWHINLVNRRELHDALTHAYSFGGQDVYSYTQLFVSKINERLNYLIPVNDCGYPTKIHREELFQLLLIKKI